MATYIIGIVIGLVLCFILQTKFIKKQKIMDRIEAFVKRVGVMNLILILLFVGTYAFVQKMISLFETFGSTPDVLISCFFVAVTGEAGIMGWIKNRNERNREREWQLEDERRHSQHK